MTVHQRTLEMDTVDLERARRQKAADMARAANQRQGYVHDPIHEAGVARYVAGEITMEELRAETMARIRSS